MCTVTYIPTNQGFIFTSNRDEHYSRSHTTFPTIEKIGNKTVTYPKDPLAHGTWIAARPNQLICLLNGGIEKHIRNLPYAKSRGTIVLEQFLAPNFNTFVSRINLDKIEPFTMISLEWDDINTVSLQELIWDGQDKHLTSKQNDAGQIWSSSTLYTQSYREKRLLLFSSSPLQSAEDIMQFHTTGGVELGLENQFKMERQNGVKTISTTQIIVENQAINMRYNNHESSKQTIVKIN